MSIDLHVSALPAPCEQPTSRSQSAQPQLEQATGGPTLTTSDASPLMQQLEEQPCYYNHHHHHSSAPSALENTPYVAGAAPHQNPRRQSSGDSYNSESEQHTTSTSSMRSSSTATTISEGAKESDKGDAVSHCLMSRSTSNTTVAPSIMTHSSVNAASAIRQTGGRYALADFEFLRTIGTGSFGRVHLVKSCHNSRCYAMKVLGKAKLVKMKQVEHTNSERAMLERVRHPFLVTLWGTFSCSANVYMVQQVMDFIPGGELFTLLRRSQRFPDPVAKFFAAEVSLALDYLHCMGIIYRDLKPENLLLGADGHLKLTDFGFAKMVPDVTFTLCGTPDYLAPEIVSNRAYNKSVDWYALGVLIFEMLAGYPPFYTDDPSPMKLYERILKGKLKYPSYLSLEAKDLVKRLLMADLTKRYGNMVNGSRDIFNHPWFHEVDWDRLYKKQIPAPWMPRVASPSDASCFDTYPEIDIKQYGREGPDTYGHLFAAF